MTPASRANGPVGSERLAAAGEALAALNRYAVAAAEDVLHHVPDTGDHVTGRAVDDAVEQASDTLRALAERLAETLGRLGIEHPPGPAAGRPRGADRRSGS